jgi:hypothetical protein
MLKPLWDNLKAIVQNGANTSKNFTNDGQKKQAIENSVQGFLNQPTPQTDSELIERSAQAIRLQGEWNTILAVAPPGVPPSPHAFNFGNPGNRVPGQMEAVYGTSAGPQAIPGQSDVTWGQ